MSDQENDLIKSLRNRDVPVVENALIAQITKSHRKKKESKNTKSEEEEESESALDKAARLIKEDIKKGINPFGTEKITCRSPESVEKSTSPIFETYEKTIDNLSESFSAIYHTDLQPHSSQFSASTPQAGPSTQQDPAYIDDDLRNLPSHLNLSEPKENLFTDLGFQNSPVQTFLNLGPESESRSFPKPKKIQFHSFVLEPIKENKMAETFDYTLFHRMIPEYSGNKDDLNRFIACCDQFLSKYTEANNRALFMQALVRKLTDRAFEFYNKQTISTWETFKEAFRKYFASQQSFEGYQIELAKVKQNNMSIRKYGEKIEKILNEINKICADIKVANASGEQFFKVQNERLAIKSFINGLNDPYKNIMRSRKFTTMNEAISDAIELETDEIINSQLVISDSVATNQYQQNTISNGNQNNPSNDVTGDNKNRGSNNNNIVHRQVICFRCGTPNHKANECRRQPFQFRMPDMYRSNFNNFRQPNFNFQNNQMYRNPPNSYPNYGSNFRNNNNNYNYQNRFQPNQPFQGNNINQNYSNRVAATGRQDFIPRFNQPNQYNFMQNARNNYPSRTFQNSNPFNANNGNNSNANQRTNPFNSQQNTNPFRNNQNANTSNNNINRNTTNTNANNGNTNIQSCDETKNESPQSCHLDEAALNFLIA